MNAVNLIGRWVRDHDATTTQAGVFIVKNTLAVDHPFKKDDSSFIRIVMFGKTGELANEYTGKGSQVAISGHIQTGSYEKDGQKVYTTDVIASNIKFLEPRKDGQGTTGAPKQEIGTNTQPQYQNGGSAQQTAHQGQNIQGYTRTNDDPFSNNNGPIEVSDDDLPF